MSGTGTVRAVRGAIICEPPVAKAAGVTITIPGAPRTKKTHNRLVRAGGRYRVLPSATWSGWCERACFWLARIAPLPDQPYNVAALFYRDARRGDAVGYYQGLADVLEAAGIVSNDKYLVAWDGSRLLVDRDNPRVVLTLTPLTP